MWVFASAELTHADDAETDTAALIDYAELLLGTLEKFGHILGPGVVARGVSGVRLACAASSPDALDPRHFNARTQRVVEDLTRLCGAIAWHVEAPADAVALPAIAPGSLAGESLYLSAQAHDPSSPVVRLRERERIPLYLLPIEPHVQESLWSWAQTSRRLNEVWLDSGAIEIPAYRALAEAWSGHMREGKALAQFVEAATGAATYVRVKRYYALNRGEDTRPCPLCGGAWRHDGDGFEFRCEPCRLLSEVGTSLESERLARIGLAKPAADRPRLTGRRRRR